MIALNILDRKECTKGLFIGNIFDHFLLSEASITTYCTFTIDGSLHKNFYPDEEQQKLGFHNRDLALWEECRSFCFSIIKGKHTPLHFKLVFQLSPEDTDKFIQESGLAFSSGDVFGLFLNVIFDGNTLTCTTGTSMRLFTLDKSLDHSWDTHVIDFFKQNNIATEKIS